VVCLGHLCGNYENVFYAGCGGTNFLDRASYKGDSTEILSNPIDLLNSCLDILWNIKWICFRKKNIEIKDLEMLWMQIKYWNVL
jgi:hypothetical protein